MIAKEAPGAVRAPAPDGSVLFIGNATLLIRFGSLTLLTDPNFVGRGAEVTLGFGLTAVRTTDPAVEVDTVDQPDLVLLSHAHGDHFDDLAADWLHPQTPIVTCPGAAPGLEERGFTSVRPLETWATYELERGGTRLRVTAAPARHAAGPLALALPPVMGSVLELWLGSPQEKAGEGGGAAPPDLIVYISGDTLLDEHTPEIRQRFPRIDLAFIHLGGTRVLGMPLGMDAAQGVELVKLLSPELAIPIHYNDYATSSSPLAEFVALVNGAGLSERVRYLRHGEAWPLRVRRPASLQPR